jgi:hypothetical protein
MQSPMVLKSSADHLKFLHRCPVRLSVNFIRHYSPTQYCSVLIPLVASMEVVMTTALCHDPEHEA